MSVSYSPCLREPLSPLISNTLTFRKKQFLNKTVPYSKCISKHPLDKKILRFIQHSSVNMDDSREIVELQVKNLECVEERNRLERERNQMEVELGEARRRIKGLEEKKKKMKRNAEELKNENEKGKREINELIRTKIDKERELSNSMNNNIHIFTKLVEYKRKNESLKNEIDELKEGVIKHLQKEMKCLKETYINETKEKCEIIETIKLEKEKRENELAEMLETKDSKIMTMKNDMKTIYELIGKLEKENTKSESLLKEELKIKNENIKSLNEKHHQEIQDKDKEIHCLKNEQSRILCSMISNERVMEEKDKIIENLKEELNEAVLISANELKRSELEIKNLKEKYETEITKRDMIIKSQDNVLLDNKREIKQLKQDNEKVQGAYYDEDVCDLLASDDESDDESDDLLLKLKAEEA